VCIASWVGAVTEPQAFTFTFSGKRYTLQLSPSDFVRFEEDGAVGYMAKPFSGILNTNVVLPADRGKRTIYPSRPRRVLSKPYHVALYLTFRGTSGFFSWGNRRRQYIRPYSGHAKAVSYAVALARELTRQAKLWTAILRVHGTDATYYVRGFNYWLRKYNENTPAYPEVRLYLSQFMAKGIRKRKDYTFDLIMLYVEQAKAKPVLYSRQDIERAMSAGRFDLVADMLEHNRRVIMSGQS
jgi:hypothetical protein